MNSALKVLLSNFKQEFDIHKLTFLCHYIEQTEEIEYIHFKLWSSVIFSQRQFKLLYKYGYQKYVKNLELYLSPGEDVKCYQNIKFVDLVVSNCYFYEELKHFLEVIDVSELECLSLYSIKAESKNIITELLEKTKKLKLLEICFQKMDNIVEKSFWDSIVNTNTIEHLIIDGMILIDDFSFGKLDLKSLQFSWSQINTEQFTNSLKSLKNLEKLYLKIRGESKTELMELGTVISRLSKLKEISITDTIGNEQCNYLFGSLCSSISIETVSFQRSIICFDNHVDNQVFLYISFFQNLKQICFNNVLIGDNINNTGLMNILSSTPRIFMNSAFITDFDMENMSYLLLSNNNLEYIDLQTNELTDASLPFIKELQLYKPKCTINYSDNFFENISQS